MKMAKDSDFFDPIEDDNEESFTGEKIKAWNLTGKPTTSFKIDQIKLLEVTSSDGMENLKELIESINDIKTRKQPVNMMYTRDVARNFLLEFEEELSKNNNVFIDDVLTFFGVATSGLRVSVYALLEIDEKKIFFTSF